MITFILKVTSRLVDSVLYPRLLAQELLIDCQRLLCREQGNDFGSESDVHLKMHDMPAEHTLQTAADGRLRRIA